MSYRSQILSVKKKNKKIRNDRNEIARYDQPDRAIALNVKIINIVTVSNGRRRERRSDERARVRFALRGGYVHMCAHNGARRSCLRSGFMNYIYLYCYFFFSGGFRYVIFIVK